MLLIAHTQAAWLAISMNCSSIVITVHRGSEVARKDSMQASTHTTRAKEPFNKYWELEDCIQSWVVTALCLLGCIHIIDVVVAGDPLNFILIKYTDLSFILF